MIDAYAAPEVSFLQVRGAVDAGSRATAESVIDLSHEALIRQWERLCAWVADEAARASEYRRWRERATEHADARGSLLAGPELARAVEWLNPRPTQEKDWQPDARWARRYARDGSAAAAHGKPAAADAPAGDFDRTKAYIEASLAEQERLARAEAERRQRELDAQTERAQAAEAQAWRSRRQNIFLGVLALLMVGVTLLAWRFKSDAEKAGREATLRRMAADSVAMVSAHRPGGDLDGARLALAAYRIEPNAESWSALQTAFEAGARLVRAAEVLQGAVTSVTFSADGQRLASGGQDGTVRLWDAKSGEPVGQPLEGHAGWVTSVAWSADGQRLASGGEDGTVRLWDAKSGEPVGQPLKGHAGWVTSVAWSAAGQRVATSGQDGTVRLWHAPATWPKLLCARLTRNFSHREWAQYVGDAFPYHEQCPGLPMPQD